MNNQNLNNLKIFQDWILCLPIKQEREYKGLVAPTTFEDKTSFAKVVMLGNEVKKLIKVGEIVVFNQYSPISLEYGDKTYLCLKEEDIIGSYNE